MNRRARRRIELVREYRDAALDALAIAHDVYDLDNVRDLALSEAKVYALLALVAAIA